LVSLNAGIAALTYLTVRTWPMLSSPAGRPSLTSASALKKFAS